LAMQPAKKDFPVPTSPQMRSPEPFFHLMPVFLQAFCNFPSHGLLFSLPFSREVCSERQYFLF
jgi:hypothetical protein